VYAVLSITNKRNKKERNSNLLYFSSFCLIAICIVGLLQCARPRRNPLGIRSNFLGRVLALILTKVPLKT